MKKTYVKPEAFSVAFAVNENIATSIFTESADGTITYVQSVEGCNKYINSTQISTGLKDGCTDITHVMEHLKDRLEDANYIGSDLATLAALLAKLEATGQTNDFICAQ